MTNEQKIKILSDKLTASGITDEDEQIEIIMRDYSHLLNQPTEAEIEAAKGEMLTQAVEKAIADLNRESIKENGQPFAVCQRIDGVKHFKRYDALSNGEIAELRQQGVIL
jgi:intracellular sulfur oxidation DsrE/DsrF family protein